MCSSDLYLWLLQMRAGNSDAARETLASFADVSESAKWPAPIVRYYKGEIDRDSLLSSARGDKEHQCEAYYYVGEKALLDKERDSAIKWFRKCVDTGVTNFIEHRLALWRLKQFDE